MRRNYEQERFLRTAREAAGLTQEEAARRIQSACRGHRRSGELQPCMFDASQLSRFESGVRQPAPEHVEAISKVYGTSSEELRQAIWHEQTDPVNIGMSCLNGEGDIPDEVRATKRRAFIRAAGVSTTAALSGITLECLDTADAIQSSDLPWATLKGVHDQVDALTHALGHTPYDVFQADLEELTTQVTALLMRKVSLGERSDLTADLAKLNGLLGTVAVSTGRNDEARVHFMATRSLATEIRHADLVAWSHSVMAYAALLEGKPQEALVQARIGLQHAQHPMLKARLLCQGEIQAHAVLGNRDAMLGAIRQAEQLTGQVPSGTDGHSTFSFDPAHVPYYAAAGYAQLGTEPERARENGEHALSLYEERGFWPRSRWQARIDIAGSYAQSNEPVEACRIATEMLTAQSPFSALLMRVRMLERSLTPYEDHPAVHDLHDRLAVWKRGGSQALTSSA